MKTNLKFLISALVSLTLMSCTETLSKTDLQDLGNIRCQTCFTDPTYLKLCKEDVSSELKYLDGPCSNEFNDVLNIHYSSLICEDVKIVANSEYHKCMVEKGKKDLGSDYEYITLYCKRDSGDVEPNCEVNKVLEAVKYPKCLDIAKEYYTKLAECKKSSDTDTCIATEDIKALKTSGEECAKTNYPEA